MKKTIARIILALFAALSVYAVLDAGDYTLIGVLQQLGIVAVTLVVVALVGWALYELDK